MSSPRVLSPRIATVVLVGRDGDVLGQLPACEVSTPWWQDAGAVVQAIHARHGLSVTVLRLVAAERPSPPGGAVTYLAELAQPPPPGLPVSPWHAALDDHPLRVSWARPGGPARDLAWADAMLAARGEPRTGPAAQVRTWHLSSLWRLPTAAGAAWLKAIPPFAAPEARVLAMLAGRAGSAGLAPRALARHVAHRGCGLRSWTGAAAARAGRRGAPGRHIPRLPRSHRACRAGLSPDRPGRLAHPRGGPRSQRALRPAGRHSLADGGCYKPWTVTDFKRSTFRSWLRAAWQRWSKLVIGFVIGAGVCAGVALWLTLRPLLKAEGAYELRVPVPSSGHGLELALYQTVGAQLRPGHQLKLLDNGAVFDALIADIARARSSIHIVMYIWERGRASDRLSAALIERAKAGVACRIVIDAFGSSEFAATIKPALDAAGCEVRMFRPLPGISALARNHRKIVVIDGRLAVTGGFGVRDNWLGDGVHDEGWRDTNVELTGPAVRDAQLAFAENWQEAGGALLPDTAFPEPEATGPVTAALVASEGSLVVTHAERLTQLVIVAATRRLWIENAYLVPSPAVFRLLLRKAAAGVDVRILVPGIKSDSKPSFVAQQKEYGKLLAAGIRVWEYTPSMIHAKTMLADDELAVIGSINLDPLSLNVLDEAALVAVDRQLVSQLARDFEADAQHAKEQVR